MKSVALYFGSFNPIHQGHVKIAEVLLEKQKHDEVWFVISPQSPFKNANDLASEKDRFALVELSCRNRQNLKACDIEFTLSKPSYTINTLDVLKKHYLDIEFSILMGEDNWEQFHLWKDAEKIVNNFEIYVYPRENSEWIKRTSEPLKKNFLTNAQIFYFDAPLLIISSTLIRENPGSALQKGYITSTVYEYIREHNLYMSSN